MAAIDDPKTIGRANLDFASEHDIDEFVEMLGKFESGEMAPDVWRRFRPVRGTYRQRQDGVPMVAVQGPQGNRASPAIRPVLGAASRDSPGCFALHTRP